MRRFSTFEKIARLNKFTISDILKEPLFSNVPIDIAIKNRGVITDDFLKKIPPNYYYQNKPIFNSYVLENYNLCDKWFNFVDKQLLIKGIVGEMEVKKGINNNNIDNEIIMMNNNTEFKYLKKNQFIWIGVLYYT